VSEAFQWKTVVYVRAVNDKKAVRSAFPFREVVIVFGKRAWDFIVHKEFYLVRREALPIFFVDHFHRAVEYANLSLQRSLRPAEMVAAARGIFVED
jgi:hypothetical protein